MYKFNTLFFASDLFDDNKGFTAFVAYFVASLAAIIIVSKTIWEYSQGSTSEFWNHYLYKINQKLCVK